MAVKAKPAKRRVAPKKKNNKAMSVRFRNDGEQYHVLWTIRRILRLLDPKTHLQAVAVEGVHDAETVQDSDGILAVDTAEYYGPKREQITRAIYNQLKYSTTKPDVPWNAAGIADTMADFAKLYQDQVKKLGQSEVDDNARFRFVTNRPISKSVMNALKAAQAGTGLRGLTQAEKAAYKSLFKGVNLRGVQMTSFASLVELAGEGNSLAEEARQVSVQVDTVTTGLDGDIVPKLSALVRDLGTSPHANSKVVDIDGVLRVFGLGTEHGLFPCPATFLQIQNAIPREQEGAIVSTILGSTTPCVIHASSGVGKTILAQRLGQLLPNGSEVVLFDGFGGGNYRNPFKYRHKHSQGMVQICNELAVRGLCDLLIPSKTAGWEQYLKPFNRRMEQAAAAVRARGHGAVLALIVDAADNLGMAAADEALDRSFVWDLMQMTPPEGCRIVALARTERVNENVKPVDSAKRIPLPSFSPAESLANLHRTYPEATEAQAREFDKLTSSNPRVQATVIATTDNLDALMGSLGTSVMGPDQLIASQLDDAISKIRRIHAAKPTEFDPLCRALAALPPPVPLATLSQASGLSEDAIKSFVTDFAGGRPIVMVGNAAQFVDEPVEKWFKDRFLPDEKREFSDLADLLLPAAGSDTYVSVALPMVLQRADRYEELMTLALSGVLPENASPVAKREVVLNRVRYALKCALAAGKVPDTVKLFLRAGEEVAADGRQIDYLMDNADLVTLLSDPSMAREFIFRRQLWLQEMDAAAKCAVMLSTGDASSAEAQRFLRRGLDWLADKLDENKKRDTKVPFDTGNRLTSDHVSNILEAVMNIRGIEGAKRFMRWNPWFGFEVMRKYARRCIDRNNTAKLAELLEHFSGKVELSLAIILEMNAVCAIPERKHIETVLGLLMTEVKFADFDGESVRLAVVCVAEAAIRHGIAADKAIALLDLYPVPHSHAYSSHDRKDEREAVMRAAALKAALLKKPLTLDDVMPESVKTYKAEKAQKKPGHHLSHNVEKPHADSYGPLLTWYEYRARAVIGRKTKLKALLRDLAASTEKGSWQYTRESEGISNLNLVGTLWAEALLWLGNPIASEIEAVGKWLNALKVMIFIPTWTGLARRVARADPNLNSTVFWFAERARSMIGAAHDDASSDARCYADLARALIPVGLEEAAAHFQKGVDLLGNLGDETYDRMTAMLSLASKASEAGVDQKEAYRLGRMAEVFCAHNSHKFPWDDVIETVTKLDPSSGFAFAARLQDRGVENYSNSVSTVTLELLSTRKLTPQVAASLHAFGGYWALGKYAGLFLGTGMAHDIKQTVQDTLIRDADESRDYTERTPNGWLDVARAQQLDVTRLEAMIAYAEKFADNKTYAAPVEQPPPVITEDDWDIVFQGIDLHTAAGMNEAMVRRSNHSYPIGLEIFMGAVRRRVDSGRRSAHVLAVASSDEMYVSHIVDQLEIMATEWGTSLVVKKAISDAAKHLIKQRGMEVLTQGWPLGETMRRTAEMAEMPVDKAFQELVAGLADHVEEVSAEWLFQLASMLTREILDANKAMEALKYGLDRLDLIMHAEDGDGTWSEDLRPPAVLDVAVARFVYAALSDVDAKVRWQATHAVRRLCKFQQTAIVAELARLIGSKTLPGFRDKRFLFYSMHAELHLLTALARSAVESADALVPHATVLYRVATGDLPHVVLRHFAKAAATALEEQRPGTYSAEQLAALSRVNVSQLVLLPRDKQTYQKAGWGKAQHDGVYRFHFDFAEYWAQPVARIFSTSDDAVVRLAEGWIKKWDLVTAGEDREDARFDAVGYSEDTYASHGTRPRKDNMSFYASWHALMCAAGELLGSANVVEGYGDENEWEEWLSNHVLTRSDGRWLADRRDLEPLEARSWETEKENYTGSAEWPFSVTHADLDSAIGLVPGSASVIVSGTKFIIHGSRRENIEFRSGLVSPKTAEALLRAAQTSDSSYHYHIPSSGSDSEVGLPGFSLDGWAANSAESPSMDEYDPFAGHLPWRGPRPGKSAIELMGLTSDDEGRVWSVGAELSLRSLIYGDRSGNREWELRDYGDVLIATPAFLKAFLQKQGRDLILDVCITRKWGSHDEENTVDYAYRNYFKLYLLRQDGSIVTLNGSGRLW